MIVVFCALYKMMMMIERKESRERKSAVGSEYLSVIFRYPSMVQYLEV